MRAVRSEIGALRDELAAIMRGGGTLAIGAVMGSMPVWLTPVLKFLREVQPDISVEVWEDNSAQLLSMLDQRLLDLVIGRPSISVHPEAYDFIPLEVEEVCFVVDGADPLAREAHLTLADLGGNPWIRAASHATDALAARAAVRRCRSAVSALRDRNVIDIRDLVAAALRRGNGRTGTAQGGAVFRRARAGGGAADPRTTARRALWHCDTARRDPILTQPVQRFIELCVGKRDSEM